jgi:hypothetical protein
METLLDYVKSNGTTNLSGLECSDKNSEYSYYIFKSSKHSLPQEVIITIFYPFGILIQESLKDHYKDQLTQITNPT